MALLLKLTSYICGGLVRQKGGERFQRGKRESLEKSFDVGRICQQKVMVGESFVQDCESSRNL